MSDEQEITLCDLLAISMGPLRYGIERMKNELDAVTRERDDLLALVRELRAEVERLKAAQ